MGNRHRIVAGRIVKLDLKDYRHFVREVMTVRDDCGRKFWGTQPRFLYDAKEGAEVAFRAEVEPSPDNPADHRRHTHAHRPHTPAEVFHQLPEAPELPCGVTAYLVDPSHIDPGRA